MKYLILILSVLVLMVVIVFSVKQTSAPKSFVNGLGLDQKRVQSFVKGFKHE